MAQEKVFVHQIQIKKERASACSPVRASMTVEASLACPLFFFAVLALIYLLEIRAIRISVRCGAQAVCQETAEQMYTVPAVLTGSLESRIAEQIGEERLDASVIVGGSSGLDCSGTFVSPVTGEIWFDVTYQVKLPFPEILVPAVTCRDAFRIKGWTGYVKSALEDLSGQSVYVTANGSVYHTNLECTYLDLSIRMVDMEAVAQLRNLDGGKYYPCEKCMGETQGRVYITQQGDRYHSSLACSGLKRSIYAISIEETGGREPCSRCGH